MTIVWSAGSGASNPHYVGIDASTDGSTVWVDYWVKATYAVDDDQTLNRTGDVTGAVNYYLGSPAAVKVSSASFAGTPGQTYNFGAYLTGVYNGGSPSVTTSLTVPIQPPDTPSNLTATRVNDGQADLAWWNTDPYSAQNPYENVVVRRSIDDGSWAIIATLGVVTSFSAGLSSDHKWWFQVFAANSAGWSGTTESNVVFTTPAAPTSVAAAKSGVDIVVTFDHAARYPTGAKVYASQDGGAFAYLATIASTSETYTHMSPSAAVTWAYKVSATNGALESAKSSASNTVQLQAAPLAPTLLAPAGAADAAEVVTFQWQHNPVDTTGQTAYELDYKVSGGAYTTLSGTTAEFRALAAATLINGLTYVFRARTKGAHADWSPYSAAGTFVTSARPTGSINTPGATHALSTLTVTWGYYDAESTAQSQWRATLAGATTEVLTGSGTATQATFTTSLPDGSTWDVTVEVRDGAGLWSTPATVAVAVAYAQPATPTLTALFTVGTGSVALTVTNPTPVSPEVATDHNDLYRSLDAGATWILIGTNVPVNGTMVDPLPRVGGPTLYKAIAVSVTPSAAQSVVVGVDTSTAAVHQSWCYANWGDGFTNGIRLRANARVNSERERLKVLNTYSDREDPVESAGTPRTHTLTITSKITLGGESTRDELEALADAPAPICWRDPTGRRMFCSSGRVSTSAFHMAQDAGVTLTKVHHVE